MRARWASLLGAVAVGLFIHNPSAHPQTIGIELKPRNGIRDFVRYYRPRSAELSPQPAAKLQAQPEYRSGTPQYAAIKMGNVTDSLITIVVDEPGDVYITGYSHNPWQGPAGQDPLNPFFEEHNGFDLYVLKLRSGGAYGWHSFYGNRFNDVGIAVGIDKEQNLFLDLVKR